MEPCDDPKGASSKHSREASVVFTIYCHIHRDSGRRYVGQTKKTWKQRWNQHIWTANRVLQKGWSHFAGAIRKYGKDAFDHEILELCGSQEEADVAEEKWIVHFNSRDRKLGFNVARGGNRVPVPVGEAALKAASNRSKVLWEDPDIRKRIMTNTQAALQRPEVRAKLSASVTELWKDPTFREKNLEAAAIGRKPEVLEKLRRNWDDPEFREKCSVGTRARTEAEAAKTHCLRGHPRTPENLDSNRECKVCIHDRRVDSRFSCPKGHPYVDGSFNLTPHGRRDCLVCREASKGPRPCTKCGKPKARRSGGGKMRCGPCTDARVAGWKAGRS